MRDLRVSAPALASAVSACLVACATYSPLPLDTAAAGRADVAQLRHDGALPARLGVDDVERLALANNPDLIAARSARGLSQAQIQLAGLLPNPVFSGSYQDILGGPGAFPAVAAGISQAVKSLITLSARRNAARRDAQAVDASIVWQEWQTIGKARLSAIDLIDGERQLGLLRENAALWRAHVERIRAALAQGDATLATLAPELAAAGDAQQAAADFERQQETRRRDLNSLLGLAPSARLELGDTVSLAPLDSGAIRAALPDLANRRPDLVALQLGYAAQEENVRAAILAQFPLLSLGPGYATDPSDVRSLGPQITMELPVFDRNQGNIARERATRAQLRAQFEARLLAARSEVEALLAERELLQRRLAAERELLAEIEPAAARAQGAYDRRDIDERSYVDLMTTRNARRQEVLTLELGLLEQQVAVATLAGAGMPPMMPAGSPAGATEPNR